MNDHDCQIGVVIEINPPRGASRVQIRCLTCNRSFNSHVKALDYLCFLYGEEEGLKKWKKVAEEYNKLKEK